MQLRALITKHFTLFTLSYWYKYMYTLWNKVFFHTFCIFIGIQSIEYLHIQINIIFSYNYSGVFYTSTYFHWEIVKKWPFVRLACCTYWLINKATLQIRPQNPLSQQAWHNYDYSIIKFYKRRAKDEICRPSPAILICPYEWNIFQLGANQ